MDKELMQGGWCQILGELLRYGVVGAIVNLTGYALFLLLTYFGTEHKIAMSLLYISGVIVGFFGNRRWTFGSANGGLGSGFRYVCAHTAGYAINMTMLFVMVDLWGYPYQLVQILAVFIVAVFLFVAFKLFVFPATNRQLPSTEGGEF